MTGATTLAAAISALVTEKRAVGYKYDAEQRVLARFEASAALSSPVWARSPKPRCRRGWPAPSGGESSQRPCTAWWRRSGNWPAGWADAALKPTSCPPACCRGRPATSRTFTPTGNWQPCSPQTTRLRLPLIMAQVGDALTVEVMRASVREHRAIAKAIVDGDGAAAAAATRAHLERAATLAVARREADALASPSRGA